MIVQEMVVFFIVLKIWKFVSVASNSALLTLVTIGLVTMDWDIVLYGSILFVIVLIRHRSNFKNIKNGVEPKVTWI